MADLERVIMRGGYSALEEQAYAAEIYNAVVVDWEGQTGGRSVRDVGGQHVELTVRGYIDPRTNTQRYALYLDSDEEELTDFNSLKAAQAAHREKAVERAGDWRTAWTDTDVRAARALQRQRGYPVGSDLSRPPVQRGAQQAAAGQGSLLDIAAADQVELTITADRELVLDADEADRVGEELSEEDREALDELVAETRAAALAEAELRGADIEEPEALELEEGEPEPAPAEEQGDGLSAAEQFVLREEFLAPYEAERAEREAEAAAVQPSLIEASTGSYTPQEWAALLDEFGDQTASEGEEAGYDTDRFTPSEFGTDGLRELTEDEIDTREALWEAIFEHGEDLGNEAIVGAYERAAAARQQAESAELDRYAEETASEIWGERTEFLNDLQQEAGATEEQKAALAAAVESLRASEWLKEPEQQQESGAEAAARESLRASEFLREIEAEQAAEAATGGETSATAAQAEPAEAIEAQEPAPAPTEEPRQQAQPQAPSAEQLSELREAMGELLRLAQGHDGLRATPEYDGLTALWSAGEQFWRQAGELVSHYGQELRQDIRMQGVVRGAGTFLADGIAGASTRMSGWMIANEAADHPVTRALQRLAGAAQNWAERLRGNDPVSAFEEFHGRGNDFVSSMVAAEREELAQTPQIGDGGELAGGESAADLVAQMFDGSPVERMHEAVAAAAAAETAGQGAKPERPKAAALTAHSSGIEL